MADEREAEGASAGGRVAFERDGRPAPAPTAPPKGALHEVYTELLAIERARLAVAVRIERERGFVFPETSVIVRDVRTLAEKVYGGGELPDRDDKPDAPGDDPGAQGDEFDFLRSL